MHSFFFLFSVYFLNLDVILKYEQQIERNLLMVELNEKDLCLEIREYLTWDNSVKNVFEDIHNEIKDWYENNLDDINENDAERDEMENCGRFLDTINNMGKDLTRDLKVAILKNIMEHWEMVMYRNYCNSSIFDDDVIREGIYQTIEDEFNFDAREM